VKLVPRGLRCSGRHRHGWRSGALRGKLGGLRRPHGWNTEWRVEGESGALFFDKAKALRYLHHQAGERGIPLVEMPAENQDYSLLELE